MQDLVAKYKEKLKQQLELKAYQPSSAVFSREYQQFRDEVIPTHMGLYEKACQFSEKIMKPKVNPEKAAILQNAIDTCHLQITPSGVASLSILLPVAIIILGIAFSLVVLGSLFFMLFFILVGLAGLYALGKLPKYLADIWRMKTSNQMVLCIFYVVTYMRHTSNLELAIEFASEHLTPPLSLDLRKVIWGVESGVYENIKESLEAYLATWRRYNMEFVESFHLIESSLYETSEDRRLASLDRSLDTILDETYEKMLHYAQGLKGPITMLHMLGIILPILGLVILPLAISFMEGIRWYHLAILYNIILPVIVFFMGKNILSKRPTGYGETDISELNPEIKKYRNIVIKLGKTELKIHPAFICVAIGVVLLFIALIPVLIHAINPDFEMVLPFGLDFLGYRESSVVEGKMIGPFGVGAALLSLFFPAALALSVGLYYKLRSKNVIKIRNEAKKLEDEFSGALFQLGNRLGDGIPAEIAFSKVADVMEETTSGRFFKMVSMNISKLGMGVKEAIFNPQTGALIYFPSAIIQSSMKVLIESVKKGPIIAAQAILNVARYIKEIHKVNERLKDLMAEIISDMKSQLAFLSPAISGIVVGITSMITLILGKLSGNISQLSAEQVGTGIGQVANLFGDGMPTYYFQTVVGVYIFQIVFILTILANGIENGADKLQERYSLGANLIKSTLLYCFIAGTVMLIFSVIATHIIATTKLVG